jgi:hypothetical protein
VNTLCKAGWRAVTRCAASASSSRSTVPSTRTALRTRQAGERGAMRSANQNWRSVAGRAGAAAGVVVIAVT